MGRSLSGLPSSLSARLHAQYTLWRDNLSSIKGTEAPPKVEGRKVYSPAAFASLLAGFRSSVARLPGLFRLFHHRQQTKGRAVFARKSLLRRRARLVTCAAILGGRLVVVAGLAEDD